MNEPGGYRASKALNFWAERERIVDRCGLNGATLSSTKNSRQNVRYLYIIELVLPLCSVMNLGRTMPRYVKVVSGSGVTGAPNSNNQLHGSVHGVFDLPKPGL